MKFITISIIFVGIVSCFGSNREPTDKIVDQSINQEFDSLGDESTADDIDVFTENFEINNSTGNESDAKNDPNFALNTENNSMPPTNNQTSNNGIDFENTAENGINEELSNFENSEINEKKILNESRANENQSFDGDLSLEADFKVAQNQLWWVGFDYKKKEAEMVVELITEGHPKYNVYQEENLADQKEIVIRFFDTKLRRKLRRPLDTSEFSGPISFIRSQYNNVELSTDVTITLRDNVKPKLFSHEGNVLLYFPIPEKYRGNIEVKFDDKNVKDSVVNSSLLPEILPGSVKPLEGYIPSYAKKDYSEKLKRNKKDRAFHRLMRSKYQLMIPVDQLPEYLIPEKMEENVVRVANESINDTPDEIIPEGNSTGSEDEFINNQQPLEANGALNEQAPEKLDDEAGGDDFSLGDENNIDLGEGDNGPKNGGNDGFGDFNDNINTSNLDANLSNDLLDENSDEMEGNSQFSESPGEGASESEEPKKLELEGSESSLPQASQKAKVLQPVSMEFKGATLREVIRTFSLENGVNFIFPENIGGEKVYLSFNHVPWDEALQAVLETHSLGLTKLEGNVIRIDSIKTLDQEKQELEKVRESASHLIPTKVLVVRLSYADSQKVVDVVKTMLQSHAHDKRTKVQADTRTNSVIVEAIPSALAKIRSLITRIDLQTPQVKIETRIVEVLKQDNLALGINWAMPMRTDQSRGLGMGNLVFPNNINSAFSVDTGIQPSTLAKRTSVDLHFGSINNLFELDMRIRMAEDQNLLKSLQNNSVVVLDNEKAETKMGRVVYRPIPVGNGQDSLSSVEYALILNVVPHITADGAIQMNIEVENSSAIVDQAQEIPDKNTRLLKTKLLRENGQTAVIGGIYTSTYSESYLGVPYLSRIPILGMLFRSKTYNEQKRELIIMVTPTVINSDKALSSSSMQDNQSAGLNNLNNINNSGNGLNNSDNGLNNSGNGSNNSGDSDIAISEDDFIDETKF